MVWVVGRRAPRRGGGGEHAFALAAFAALQLYSSEPTEPYLNSQNYSELFSNQVRYRG